MTGFIGKIRNHLSQRNPPLNELTNTDKWENPGWLRVHLELEHYSIDKHCFSTNKEMAVRKGWEWTQCLYGLHKLGMVAPAARALGVGAGREPLLFYLADRISLVVGTDLYGNTGWSTAGGKEADPRILEETQRFCPRPFDYGRLNLITMDGTRLAFASQSFDFVWSLSSIEHFGGHKAARESIREMARVTRIGGIVVVATEFILPGSKQLDSGHAHPDYFTRRNFEEYILRASPELQPIQPMSYRLPDPVYIRDAIKATTDDVHRMRHHIVLDDGAFQWTSVIVFFRKHGR